MEPECDGVEVQAVQAVAVECVIFDRAERPKRRRVMPLLRLLAPVTVATPAVREAG